MRDASSQAIHDDMIARLVEDLEQKGYTDIRADHIEDYEERRPEKIYSEMAEIFLTPDVTASRGDRCFFFEVETEDSLQVPMTREEIRTFAVNAAEHGCLLYLVVPSELQGTARTVLEGLEEKNHRQTFVLPLDG